MMSSLAACDLENQFIRAMLLYLLTLPRDRLLVDEREVIYIPGHFALNRVRAPFKRDRVFIHHPLLLYSFFDVWLDHLSKP